MTDELSAALEAVVSRFAKMVRSVGARHRLSESDLDEVVQEVRIAFGGMAATSRRAGAAVAKRPSIPWWITSKRAGT